MKKELIFDMDIYPKAAIMKTFSIYKDIDGLSILLKEDEKKMKVIFTLDVDAKNGSVKEDRKNKRQDKDDEKLDMISKEFSNYALGLSKEASFGHDQC